MSETPRRAGLKQKGPNLFGLCPFHNEKTPSFSVAQQKQIYYCFGCHLGGNVFSFLMEYLKISFPEAVKICADKCNIDLVLDENNEGSELFSALYKIHDVALELYKSNLFSPNFMVRSIAEENDINMPSFFGFIIWSVLILVPLYFILSFLLF